jgi:hypothetical protein
MAFIRTFLKSLKLKGDHQTDPERYTENQKRKSRSNWVIKDRVSEKIGHF